jgi:hypothetical protein
MYRLEVDHPEDAVYFGEANELDRRLARYRNPGPQQQTNVRMHDVLLTALSTGGTCQVAIPEIVAFETDSRNAPLDLRQKLHAYSSRAAPSFRRATTARARYSTLIRRLTVPLVVANQRLGEAGDSHGRPPDSRPQAGSVRLRID